jgi:hypothetical protein
MRKVSTSVKAGVLAVVGTTLMAMAGCSSQAEPEPAAEADNATPGTTEEAATAICPSGWYRVAQCGGTYNNVGYGWCYHPPTGQWSLKFTLDCNALHAWCQTTGTDALGWPLSVWCN